MLPLLCLPGSPPFSSYTFQPTDYEAAMMPYIAQEIEVLGLKNVKKPVALVRRCTYMEYMGKNKCADVEPICTRTFGRPQKCGHVRVLVA